MKKQKIIVLSAVSVMLLTAVSFIRKPTEQVFADNTFKNSTAINLTLDLSSNGNPVLSEKEATYKFDDYMFYVTGTYAVAVTDSELYFMGLNEITISMPKTCSSLFITSGKDYPDSSWSMFTMSENTTIVISHEAPYGATFTRNDDNDIVLTSGTSCCLMFLTVTFNDVGSLKTYNPIGGFINQNGKKSLVAFGFLYEGPTLSSNTDFGIVIGKNDQSLDTTLNNGTINDLNSNNNKGRFYCYQIDDSETTYYAKGFIILNGTTFYTPIVQIQGNLSGTEYKL